MTKPYADTAAPIAVPPERIDETVAVLCDAFHDYPVMTHIVGEAGSDYDRRLRTLIHFFVSNRVLRAEPILGIEDGGRLVAIATLTPPGERPVPEPIEGMRAALWEALGADAKARHEALFQAWMRYTHPGLHYHLNMLGVRRSHAGRGLGSRLLTAIHARSLDDAESSGVTLSTEDPKNVPLYQHCGYEITAHERVTDRLETWQFFRPNDTAR
ncbi:MAG TPA: GNAT family N-acetyltransferase [Candidatus Eisenbacteria bacterium]|nr:GNAT family N-acetyltransferase [Candidatus Eisenbacteria bacterium]